MELLKLTWWMDDPIDYEYKQYILLDYLQKIEKHFINRDFSPYLLHTEKLYEEMSINLDFIDTFENEMAANNVIFAQEEVGLEDTELPTIKELEEMKQTLKFSVPLIKAKVKMGKELWKNSPTILW
tara:strand:- start:9258 stop:9635 length:378 start_codon:yes stop_codon:yes gene_type:complete